MTPLRAHKHSDVHRHTHIMYTLYKHPHTGSIHTHTHIQHTIRCMQFINFMGVILQILHFTFASADTAFKYLLVKYNVRICQHAQCLWCYCLAILRHCHGVQSSCYVPAQLLCTQLSSALFLLIHWHSNICRQLYYATADL